MGKTFLCGRAKRSKKEQGVPEAEEGMEDQAPNDQVDLSGGAHRQRGWWKRGIVETKINTVTMLACVHKVCVCVRVCVCAKECDTMESEFCLLVLNLVSSTLPCIDEDALTRLQGAWENSDQKAEKESRRPAPPGRLGVCVFITAVLCVFITTVPITKLFACVWGGNNGGHVLRETTSRGLCGLGCPSRSSERGVGPVRNPVL